MTSYMTSLVVVFLTAVSLVYATTTAPSLSVDGATLSGTLTASVNLTFSMNVPDTVESFYILLQVDNMCLVAFNLTELTTFEETESFKVFPGGNTRSVLYSSNMNYDSPAAGPYSLSLISENGTCNFNLSAKSVTPGSFDVNMTGTANDLLPAQPLFFEWDAYYDQPAFQVAITNPNTVDCMLRVNWYAPSQYESSTNDMTGLARNTSVLQFWGPNGSNYTSAGFFPSYFFPLIVSIEAWVTQMNRKKSQKKGSDLGQIDDVTTCDGFTYVVSPLLPPQVNVNGAPVQIQYDYTASDFFFAVNSTTDYKVNLELTDTSSSCDLSVSANSFQDFHLVSLSPSSPHAVLTGSAPPFDELGIWDLYSSSCNVTLSVVNA